MARLRIVCTSQEPVNRDHHDAHIVDVGTGEDPNRASTRWTVSQVYKAMDESHTFYTKSTRTGQEAEVMKWSCKHCGRPTLRSTPDATTSNNLDDLRPCNWRS